MSDLGFGKCNFFRVEHINTAVYAAESNANFSQRIFEEFPVMP